MLNRVFLKALASEKNGRLFIGISLLAVILVSLFSFSPLGRNVFETYREDFILSRLIKSTGAELDSVNVTGWVKVDENAVGAGDPGGLANHAAARLNLLDTGRKVESWENQYARGVKVEGRNPEGRVFTVLGQTMEWPEGKKVSYIMVSSAGAEKRKARYYKQRMNEALGIYGGESHVAITYSGKIKQDLNGEELLADAEKMMALAGAPVQEKTLKDNLVSLTGFSPRFSGDIRYAGREVNLNVALRSNPVEHVTYVYVASPVIFTEY